MEKIDYHKLGMRCGLEIHQQLDTKKLFCECSSNLLEDNPDFEISRKLRASAGETGKIDIAAKFEAKKDKTFIYQGYFGSTCLVETDDEPPHNMNQDALNIVLQVCKLMKAMVIDQIQVMRKTVIDGSNTSGFQRTSLVGRDGYVTVEGKKIRINSICIEEDAARVIKRDKNFAVYRLDRLGIPLIEIATEADITSPEEAKTVAEYLGMIVRSTGQVKRGLGTIRQDVNVSIREGARVEIKGFQDLRQLKKLAEYEVVRQKNLVDIKSKIKKPKHEPIISDLNLIFKNTNCNILRNKSVYGFKAEGLHNMLGIEIQPGKRLGTELSDYAKKAGVKGIFHSDEKLEDYGISKEEIDKCKTIFDCQKHDSFILVAAPKKQAEAALNVVIDRINILYEKIPNEVRQPNPDGTSTYLRPMPGGSRMYPETDVEPIMPDITKIKVPKLLTEQKEDLKKKFKISDDLAGLILKKGIKFDELTKKYHNIDNIFLANYFVTIEKEIHRRFNVDLNPEKYADELLPKLDKKQIPKDSILELLVDLHKGKKINFDAFRFSDQDLEKELKQIIEKFPKLELQPLMGEAMKTLKGRVSGKKVMDALKRLK